MVAVRGDRVEEKAKAERFNLFIPPFASDLPFLSLLPSLQEHTFHFSRIQQPPPRYYANEESFEASPTNEMLFRLAVADSLCPKENVGQKGG